MAVTIDLVYPHPRSNSEQDGMDDSTSYCEIYINSDSMDETSTSMNDHTCQVDIMCIFTLGLA